MLSARLVGLDGAELVAVRETAADEGEILSAIDRLSKRVRERIGESLKHSSNKLRSRMTAGFRNTLRMKRSNTEGSSSATRSRSSSCSPRWTAGAPRRHATRRAAPRPRPPAR